MFQATESPSRVLHLKGELDLATVPKLREALAKALRSEEPIVVDMREVTFIDAAGLHALADAALSLNGAGPLRLCNVPVRIVRLMEIVEMDQLPTVELLMED